MRAAPLTCAAVIMLVANPSVGATLPHHAIAITIINGTCSKMTMEEQDLSDTCYGQVFNVNYSDGRTSFTFKTLRDLTLTFSGDGHKEIKQGTDLVKQPVDVIFTSIDGVPSKPARVVGSCDYSLPDKGAITVHCHVDSETGFIEGKFTSDGQSPTTIPFP